MFSKLRRVLPVVIGLLLIALIIWFAGPYFAFADYRPLESELVRLLLIVLVFVAWGVVVILKRMKANRASDKLVAAVVEQSAAQKDQPSADVVQLRERFEEAVATLKAKRRSGHSLYDLPWYVIIGAPGSGKTTALVNSGLQFPLEQRSGKGALRGIGGTRNCDWWFTDEAVLLDTAGRYTTQDSDASADSAGWAEFLSLLRKYRRRRPINGVILTISAQDLMAMTPGGTDPHVEAARRRLTELNRELKIQLPVYVMVTKCDLIAGFTEHFDDLDQAGREQVWGVTFPYDQTVKGQAAPAFAAEFDALVTRLNERVFGRVEEDRDVRRRTKVFAFPQQLAALRDALNQFITDVFATTRFEQQVLLRGVYFTSGTQEGTPIDRLLGALGRRFAVAPEAVAAPPGRGKAYFIERLLKDVLFAESGLAGVNRRFEVQWAAAQVGAYVAMAAIAILGIALWTVSYSRNRSYVDQVGRDVAGLRDVPPVSTAASLDAALPRLDRVRAVMESANRYDGRTPLSMRWGLFQGNSLSDAARDAYSRELDGAMLPHVANRFRQRLIDYAPEPEKLYPYLKGYLMLGDPSHLDKKQLEYLANLEWEAAYAADPDRAQAVAKHFHNLLEYNDSLRPMALDQQIIAQARSTLKQASPAGLIYRYVRIGYANDTARALRLDQVAGLGAERVLRRRSRVSLSEPVPSIYTKPVFEEITTKGTDDIVRQFASESWVWGDAGPSIARSASLSAEFLDIYEKEYIATWDRILNDIQSVPPSSIDATKESLAILAGQTSPLRGLLKAIDDNTYLAKPPEPAKPGITIPGTSIGLPANPFSGITSVPGAPKVTPGAQITAHFAGIHRLMAGENGSAPIDQILKKLQDLQQKMQPLGGQVGGTNPGDPQAIASIGAAANEVKAQAAAASLPPSITAVLADAANGATSAIRGGVRDTLEMRYQQDVAKECNAIVANRYPFFANSAVDVPLVDFGRLFGYGGVYDAFFKAELAPLVDTTRATWAWRNDATGAAVGGSMGMLRQFEAAERIRQMFFRPGSQDVEVRFSVSIVDLDANALRFTLDLDGQSFVYRHDPVQTRAAIWPGPKPGMAVATFEEKGAARPNVGAEGTWAWFRLLDAAQVQRETDSSYVLNFDKGGHQAHVRIEAVSIRNPYGNKQILQQFRCG